MVGSLSWECWLDVAPPAPFVARWCCNGLAACWFWGMNAGRPAVGLGRRIGGLMPFLNLLSVFDWLRVWSAELGSEPNSVMRCWLV